MNLEIVLQNQTSNLPLKTEFRTVFDPTLVATEQRSKGLLVLSCECSVVVGSSLDMQASHSSCHRHLELCFHQKGKATTQKQQLTATLRSIHLSINSRSRLKFPCDLKKMFHSMLCSTLFSLYKKADSPMIKKSMMYQRFF